MEEKSVMELEKRKYQEERLARVAELELQEVAVSAPEAITISPELTVALGQAVATGISQGLVAVLTSPELGQVIETIAKGKAISGMLEGLVAAEGRKGLDASVMNQNALEITHLIEKAFDKFKSRAVEVSEGERGDDVDGEKSFREWVASQADDTTKE